MKQIKITLIILQLICIKSCVKGGNNNESYIYQNNSLEIMHKRTVPLDDLIEKLNENISLTHSDLDCLFNYINTKDESYSEGLGYLLYNYYYKDEKKNIFLMNYLKQFSVEERNNKTNQLIDLLSYEIFISENYNYYVVKKDFPFITSEFQSYFEKCISNIKETNE